MTPSRRKEREARRALKGTTGAKENPHLQALADAEGERDDARRHTEGLRAASWVACSIGDL